MAVDYGAGSGRRGAYANLAKALQSKLDAENTRRAEDVRRQGLFRTGISQENLSSLARTGLGIAQFGQDRMSNQMAQATERFKDRQATNKDLLEYYKNAGNYEQAHLVAQRMAREQGQFNKQIGDYRKKGILGSRFGGEAFTADFGEGDKSFIRALNQSEPTQVETAKTTPNKRRSNVRGGRPFAEANRGSAMMPQEDEFGGSGTTPLMSQRVMPNRDMEGNSGAQQGLMPTTATMTGEALGPKTYEDYLKTANPMPFPPLNEGGTHDQKMYPSWKEEEDRRQLMKKTKRFYDPDQFGGR